LDGRQHKLRLCSRFSFRWRRLVVSIAA
jgi:hypothetical protein